MGEGSLLLRALHEHRDRRPNALIGEHHENLVLVAKENRAAVAHRGNGVDLHFNNGFTHIANLLTRLPANSFKTEQNSCKFCFREMHEQRIRLEIELDGAAALIAADSARLQQVLWNLLIN